MKDFFNKIHKTDPEILEEYISYWSEYSLPKKTIMTKPEQTESYIYFVEEGVQKSYYLNDGKQHVMFFAYNPSFSGVMESFLTQTPSKYYLETITQSKFLRLSYIKHNELINKHRQLETLFRIITERFLVGIIERHHQLMAFDVQSRFTTFIKRSPHLLSIVSHKDIASYLRIDPTNFSKMMNNIRL
jgi:CRP-like cAMP-binding protein